MADFQTQFALLLEEIHRAGPADQNRATFSLIKAMNDLKNRPYWFNKGTVTTTTDTGVQKYPIPVNPGGPEKLPYDILQIRVSQIQVGEVWYKPMEIIDIEPLRRLTYIDNGLTTGYPQVFAVWARDVYLYSIPKEDFVWRLDYTKDLNRPRYRYDGQWNFEQRKPSDPTTWEPLEPGFTNEFLSEADSMIRSYAKWLMYKDYYNDPDNAQMAYQSYEEESATIRIEDTFQQSGSGAKAMPTPI